MPLEALRGKRTSDAEVQVVIVGGGLAAITLASYLYHDKMSYIIVDPNPHVGAAFERATDNTGQRVMRSPYEHYTGCHSVYDYSLLDFGKLYFSELTHFEQDQIHLANAGHRSVVPLDLYIRHMRHTVISHGIPDRHLNGQVTSIRREGGSFITYTDSGNHIHSRAIVHAVGESPRTLEGDHPKFVRWWADPIRAIRNSRVMVIGGGQTSANVAAELLNNNNSVTVANRNGGYLYRCVDSTPHFFRPAGRIEATRSFSSDSVIQFPPSVMMEYKNYVSRHVSRGDLEFVKINHLPLELDWQSELGSRRYQSYDYVIPCLGLAVEGHLGTCCMPDANCQVADSEYVIGAAAREAVGITARNIDGHRVAAERIVSQLRRTFE